MFINKHTWPTGYCGAHIIPRWGWTPVTFHRGHNIVIFFAPHRHYYSHQEGWYAALSNALDVSLIPHPYLQRLRVDIEFLSRVGACVSFFKRSLICPMFLPSSRSAIDLLYGGIYCFVCQDYIYDKDMEQIAKEEQRKAWKLQGGCCCHTFHTCFCLSMLCCCCFFFFPFSSSTLLNLHMFKCDVQHLAQYKNRLTFPDGSTSGFKAAKQKWESFGWAQVLGLGSTWETVLCHDAKHTHGF